MRRFQMKLGAAGILTTLTAGALQAGQAGDDASVLRVVAHALCAASEASYVVLDSRGAYASPILEGKLKQIGLSQEFARLLLDSNRGGVIPAGGAFDCLRVTASSKIEDAFGPKGEASQEGQRWTAFHKAFPGAKAYAAFSLPAFSVSGGSAAVYVLYSCGLSCGKGRVYLLNLTDRGWTLSKELPLWDF
jgi:hypothetical protein